MKDELKKLLAVAAAKAFPEIETPEQAHIERTRNPNHGDFASNIAMTLTKQANKAPRQIAEQIITVLEPDSRIAKVEIAGPGFINIFLQADTFQATIDNILDQGAEYGHSQQGQGKTALVEFVSANPTGPLHVGHGRGAAFGDCVARLLAACGYKVEREYYVNDAGRQMDILAASLYLRYLEALGQSLRYPEAAYRGDYVKTAAQDLLVQAGDQYARNVDLVFAKVPRDEEQDGSKDQHIDAIIANIKQVLGASTFRELLEFILKAQLDEIRQDLSNFGIEYDCWFSERSLVLDHQVEKAVETLDKAGYIYNDEGAKWFASTEFGDDKDRVIMRANGSHTYFASDIAYHLNKLNRGYDKLVDILGADHHGYVPRVRAAVEALTGDQDKLSVQLVQFAILYRGQQKLKMSTRAGQYVTLAELIDEVGLDAARFFYVMRSNDQHLDFDLELAKSQTNDNPVYYIQYAHARICSVERQLAEQQAHFEREKADLSLLTTAHEQALITELARFGEVLALASENYAIHKVVHYLHGLADAFHSYYNAHKFIVDEPALCHARLALILATRQVIHNGLNLLGVSAPQQM